MGGLQPKFEEYDMGLLEKKKWKAIERLKAFEPKGGYYLAFSGGKDSQAIYHLALEAGVKFEAHYNNTGIDPPELVRFIRSNYPDVKFESPRGKDGKRVTMWGLIEKSGLPPSRFMRYCCKALKEDGGMGRTVLTGVRWAESRARKNNRGLVELNKRANGKPREILTEDNDETRMIYETCVLKSKHTVNPIIDWEDKDVWGYLNSSGISHCSLYDEGYSRIGCVMCPVKGRKGRKADCTRYPRHYALYLRAFDKMLEARKAKGRETDWKTGGEVMEWWLNI